ncbi:MAG: glycosyl hydrolase family 28 protein, partial [Bacteroidota bacterium]|nr:glycosyl hydrolase family 28 protein [Bacteroidota bacterium]
MNKELISILILFIFFSALSKAQNYNIKDFGALAGTNVINTVAINKAILKCSNDGGGRVIIPAGEFITGTLHLKSDVNLHLERGAKLTGSLNINDYDLMPEGYYYSGKNYMGILFGNDIKNISITGNGIIDGRGTSFMIPGTRFSPSVEERQFTRQKEDYRDNKSLEDGPLKFHERPGHILTVSNAENVSIKGIEFIDSPKWTIRLGGSEHIKISDITIKNNLLIPNSDGIHVTSSSYVNVANSTVIAGDDALIVTGFISGNETYSFGNNSKEAKNIIFDNCVVSSKSAGIRVGYGEKPIKNVIFSNIIINDSNRGIGVFSRDNSNISDIYFSNIMINTRLHSDGW